MNSKDGYADNTSTYAMSRLMYLNKTYEPVPKKKWGASDSSEATQKNRMRAVGKTSNSVGFTSLSHTKGELTKNALRRVRSSGATVPKKVTNKIQEKLPDSPLFLSAIPGNQTITVSYTEGNNNGNALLNYLYSFDGITFTEFSPPTIATTVTFTGLTNGTSYTIYLKAKNSIGISSFPSEPVTATPRTIPNEPTNLSAIPGNGSIEITFTEPFNGGSTITRYEYSLNSGSSWIITGTSSPVTITGLTNGTVYTVQLRARNIVGASISSSQITVAPIPANSFNPSTISGINLWLDGQYTSSVDISNNLVATWNDRSGQNNHFSRHGGTITYAKPSGINNRPAIYFQTAPSTYLYRQFNITPSTNHLSLFMIVYHVSNVIGNSELFFSISGPTSPGYAYFDLFNNTQTNGQLNLNIGNQIQVSTSTDIRESIALVDVIATSTADIFVNGTQTNNNITRGDLSMNNVITWAVSGGAFRGYVGEVITYPSGLSDSDRQRVEGYLAWKWGIQNNLPNSQPYKTAPPISLDAPVITGITNASQSLSVAFTQSTPGGVTITNYRYSTDNGDTFRELTTPDTTSPLTITTLSSNGTTLLTNGVTYSIIIQAKTVNGLSPYSNMVQGTPNEPPLPTPTALSSVGGNQAAYILFTQTGTVTNYEYSTDGGSTFLLFNPPQTYSPVLITKQSSNSGLDSLINGTTYTIVLKAVNSGVSSDASESTTVTPTTTSLNTTNLLIELDANNSSSYSGSGNTWTNIRSSGSYSATLQNGPSFNNTNKYFTFNGTNQIAEIPQATAINPTAGSSFTVQIWARVNTSSPAFSSGDGLISKQFYSPSYDGYSLSLNNLGGVALNMNGASVNGNYSSSTGVYSNGWDLYTIVVRFGGGSGNPSYVYVSTKRVVTAANGETGIPSQAPIQFPRGMQDSTYNFCPADVGAFYLYNRALSQEDIIRNYDATKSRYGY
jgi:titin